MKHTNLREEVKRLKALVDKLVAGVPPTSVGPTSGRQCLKKIKIHGTNPDCRVIAFNRNNMLLVSILVYRYLTMINIFFF